MTKQIFINLPVADLLKATAFYQALGFAKNDAYSNDVATCLMWSENIAVMLLTRDFYRNFTDGKDIADTRKTSAALMCITMKSKEAVDTFTATAKASGGRAYQVKIDGVDMDTMYGFSIEDLDGHLWETLWMPQN